ncbi:MAG: hypothetical protein ACJAQ4_002715 [Cryomorphaceae bacterium]|jgi:hypothetical protein
MLSARTSVDSSAGYVAIEKFTGTLKGKRKRFILQHYGIMNGGKNRLTLEVVPDFGTAKLKGISDEIEIERDRAHHCILH